ncbi:MAG: hypothetical protein RPU13_13880 [Candidatus Sedimenticola sp. (ex Thyasira tokunagai)]
MNRTIPADGLQGDSLREASAGNLRELIELVRVELKKHLGLGPDKWIDVGSIYGDRIVIRQDSRLYAYPYTINDDNQVTFGQPSEVVSEHKPVKSAPAASFTESAGTFIEAVSDDESDKKGTRYLVRVIRAGLADSKTYYPDSVLREATPLFEGARVFVKSDIEHIKGQGKDVRNLVGMLTKPRFVEGKGKDEGEIQAEFEVLSSSGDVTDKLREAVERNMADRLFGLSIDVSGSSRKGRGRIREAKKFTKVHSVDLIVEPGAGGQIIKFIEALQEDSDVELRTRMIEAVQTANGGSLPQGLDVDNDEQLEAAYREAVASPNNDGITDEEGGAEQAGTTVVQQGVSADEVDKRIRMVEARADMRILVAGSGLPVFARQRLTERFNGMDRFTEADVTAAISSEREYGAQFTESGHVDGLGDGSRIEHGADRADKIGQMFDDFFDPSKPTMSFREAYIEVTGDRGVTGLLQNCDSQRMREAVASSEFREAVSSSTFGNVLGDSITRAMLREYSLQDLWSDWRWLCDVVPVSDFRTQERTRVGGYGDLPGVAEGGSYDPLTSPNDEKVNYAISKRGGTETASLEAIANDDVGLLQRIPMKLGVAAKRTLFKFVYAFLDANGAIYDAAALFHASHGNLNTAAFSATAFAANKLAMSKQAEMDTDEPLGLVLQHLVLPGELEEDAFDAFVRNTNNDETFVQSHKPTVHVVPHWTDANNWFATADKREIPLIELGFYNGQEEPELFIQDNPTQGSLFTNDQIKYKIRHIYSGAVADFRGFQGNIVP